MNQGAYVMQIVWHANPFRGDKFEDAWRPAAETALRYGAIEWVFMPFRSFLPNASRNSGTNEDTASGKALMAPSTKTGSPASVFGMTKRAHRKPAVCRRYREQKREPARQVVVVRDSHVALTGRNEAYYEDFLGTPQEFISAATHGFLYQG